MGEKARRTAHRAMADCHPESAVVRQGAGQRAPAELALLHSHGATLMPRAAALALGLLCEGPRDVDLLR